MKRLLFMSLFGWWITVQYYRHQEREMWWKVAHLNNLHDYYKEKQ